MLVSLKDILGFTGTLDQFFWYWMVSVSDTDLLILDIQKSQYKPATVSLFVQMTLKIDLMPELPDKKLRKTLMGCGGETFTWWGLGSLAKAIKSKRLT
jgi:hypothetical protein